MDKIGRAHLVFTHGIGLSGAITRWYTWEDAGHVGWQFDDGSVLDATPHLGVAYHSELAGRPVGRFTVDCTEEQQARALEWAFGEIGKKYDWTAIYGMPFRCDWHSTKGWFCSELVFAAYETAGFKLLHAMHCNRVTPRDLLMSPCLHPLT